jgi:hypothetical protein
MSRNSIVMTTTGDDETIVSSFFSRVRYYLMGYTHGRGVNAVNKSQRGQRIPLPGDMETMACRKRSKVGL